MKDRETGYDDESNKWKNKLKSLRSENDILRGKAGLSADLQTASQMLDALLTTIINSDRHFGPYQRVEFETLCRHVLREITVGLYIPTDLDKMNEFRKKI